MKHNFFLICLIFCFFIMLSFPQIVLTGASKGLLLWFNTVIPTLFPFILITNILISTHAFHLLNKFFSPLLCKLFQTSQQGAFVVISGFFCGYPMGAKTANDLCVRKYISRAEGGYLLSFCNNVSPVFIVSYIVLQNLKSPTLIPPTIFILLGSPVLCSFLFRLYYGYSKQKTPLSMAISKNTVFSMDECIMNAAETITKVGGYIILFSVITEFVSLYLSDSSLISCILMGSIELTSGILLIAKSPLSFSQKYVLILSLASFGGWCSVAQTKSMIRESHLSIFAYITEKLITTLVTSLLACLFIQLY